MGVKVKTKEPFIEKADKKVETTRKIGIEVVGDAPWGTHFCQFYQTKEDLLDILVPYFKAGLENNEFCMWVTSEPISVEEAEGALREAILNFGRYLERGQIEIVPHTQWYLKDGVFNLQRVLDAWIGKLDQALAKGYDGMRVTGNTAWLEKRDWKNFTHYEENVNSVIGKCKMIAICTYHLDKCGSFEVIDVVRNHQFALIKREGNWELIESTERKKAEGEIKNLAKFPSENPNPVLRITKDGKVLFSNGAGLPVLTKWKTKVGGVVPERWRHLIGEAFESNKARIEEEEEEEEEEEVKGNIFSFVITPVLNAAYANLYARDITERKKTERALRESENKYRTLLENLPQKIFLKDKNSVYISCNESYARDLKIESDHIAGKTDYEFYPKKLAEKYRVDDKRIMKSGKIEDIEEKYIQNGQEVIVHTVKTPLRDEKGNQIGILGIFWDITDRKKAEETLQEQRLALEQKNIALKEIVAQVEVEKNKIKDNVAANINETLLPVLKKLKIKKPASKYVDLLRHHLEDLTSSFGRKMSEKSVKLTSREIEICSMIKGGLTSKEISDLLGTSCQTVEKHRKNIRKKLNITNKGVNLSSYLHKL